MAKIPEFRRTARSVRNAGLVVGLGVAGYGGLAAQPNQAPAQHTIEVPARTAPHRLGRVAVNKDTTQLSLLTALHVEKTPLSDAQTFRIEGLQRMLIQEALSKEQELLKQHAMEVHQALEQKQQTRAAAEAAKQAVEATDTTVERSTTTTTTTPPVPTAAPTAYSNVAPSGFESCVIQRESGGDPSANNGTHFGLFQFSRPLWAYYGGDPSQWGTASAATQEAVFNTAMAKGGESNWAPYDGC